MRSYLIGLAAACMAFGSPGTASAMTCYLVYNKDDVVIYRDIVPPYDLSVTNSPERAAERQRGEQMLFAEFDKCDAVGFISATTGGSTATVDDIVAGIQPTIGTRLGGSSATSGAPGSGRAAAGAAAPSTRAAARSALVPIRKSGY